MLTEIYRDNDLLVVSKPAGLLCVPGLSSPDNLYEQVKQDYPNARVVHRLDMATSGLVIFALHYEAQKAMGRLFEQRRIGKRYRASVAGQLNDSSGEIELPLVCDWENRPRQKVCWQKGKPALTRFQVLRLSHDKTRTEVALYPVTGRTHQLRVHMQAIGHGILGDQLYSQHPHDTAPDRLMLHAEALTFDQPLSGEPLQLVDVSPF